MMRWGRVIGPAVPVIVMVTLLLLATSGNRVDNPNGEMEGAAVMEVSPTSSAQATGSDLSADFPVPIEVTKASDWWEGKEELRRKIERNRYFAADPPESTFESEEERIEARREFVFEEFEKWLKRYRLEKDPGERAQLIPEGVVRAKIRQRELETLQISDPGVALEHSLSPQLREAMPEEVRAIVMDGGGESNLR